MGQLRGRNKAVSFRMNRAFFRPFVFKGGKKRENNREREGKRNVDETRSRVRPNVLRLSVSGQTFDHLDIWKR